MSYGYVPSTRATDPPSFYDKDNARIEEGLFDMTCESVTDEQIDEWLYEMDMPRTDNTIEKAVTAIAMHRLGWDN